MCIFHLSYLSYCVYSSVQLVRCLAINFNNRSENAFAESGSVLSAKAQTHALLHSAVLYLPGVE